MNRLDLKGKQVGNELRICLSASLSTISEMYWGTEFPLASDLHYLYLVETPKRWR